MSTPTRTRTQRPKQLGVAPTNSQKLIYIANKLGLTGIAGMQGSTVNIFDTVNISTNAARQNLQFFAQTSNKSKTFSNLQNGSLNAGEAMIIENVKFMLLLTTNTDLNSDANAIINAWELSAIPDTGRIVNRPALSLGIMNISIANSVVVKDYQINETISAFNRKTTGIAPAELVDGAGTTLVPFNAVHGPSAITMEAPPVLPPNQKILVGLDIPPLGTVTGNLAVMCILGDFGSIFAAKTTL